MTDPTAEAPECGCANQRYPESMSTCPECFHPKHSGAVCGIGLIVAATPAVGSPDPGGLRADHTDTPEPRGAVALDLERSAIPPSLVEEIIAGTIGLLPAPSAPVAAGLRHEDEWWSGCADHVHPNRDCGYCSAKFHRLALASTPPAGSLDAAPSSPSVESGEAGEPMHPGHEVCVDIQANADMSEAYYKTLETHLREHGCEHDFAEVANADGRLASKSSTPDLRESVEWAIHWLDETKDRHTIKAIRSAIAIAKANLRAALASTPPAVSLDVERLARALGKEFTTHPPAVDEREAELDRQDMRRLAQRVAATYGTVL